MAREQYQVQAQSCLNKQCLASFQCHLHHKHSQENFKLKDAYLITPPIGVMGLAALSSLTLKLNAYKWSPPGQQDEVLMKWLLPTSQSTTLLPHPQISIKSPGNRNWVCPMLSVSGILVPSFTGWLQERSMVSKSQLMDQKAEEPNILRSGYDHDNEPLEGYDGDVLQDDPEEAFYLPGPQPQERSNMEPKDNGYNAEFDNGVHGQQDRHINWDDDNNMQNDGLDLVIHPDGKWANVPPKLANTIPKLSNVPAKSGQQKAPCPLTKDILFEHHQRNGVPRAPDPARLDAIHHQSNGKQQAAQSLCQDLNTHITQSHLENEGRYESGSEGGDEEDKGEEDIMDYPCAYKAATKLKFYLPTWRKVLHIACMFPDCMDIVEDEVGAEILLQSIEEFKAKCGILNMSYYEKYAYKMKIWMYSDLGNLWLAVKKVAQSALTETFNIEPTNALMEEDAFAHVKLHYTQLYENSRLFHNFHDGCKQVKSDDFETIYDKLCDLFDKVKDSGHYDVLEACCKQIAMLGWCLTKLFQRFLAVAACICLVHISPALTMTHGYQHWTTMTMSSNTSPALMGTHGYHHQMMTTTSVDTCYFQPAEMILLSHAVDLTSIDNDPWLSPLDDNDNDQYIGPWLSPLDNDNNELYIIDARYFQPAKMIVLAHVVDLTSIDGDPWLPPPDDGDNDYYHYHMTRTTATDDIPISTVWTVMITTNHYGTVMWSTFWVSWPVWITTTWAGWGTPVQFWADPNPSGKSGCLDRSGQILSRPVQQTSTLLMCWQY
ncbi:hypothetical protein EDC04DRAFT_2611573 [Pisolithus marmoratus]|nr:hypothetical protein EDC04DRAFT_2611573 [Pisolithus marmoratus]